MKELTKLLRKRLTFIVYRYIPTVSRTQSSIIFCYFYTTNRLDFYQRHLKYVKKTDTEFH